jgi:hypothetical protein
MKPEIGEALLARCQPSQLEKPMGENYVDKKVYRTNRNSSGLNASVDEPFSRERESGATSSS